jgi:hypothetical protein
MQNIYKLQISFSPSKQTLEEVSTILGMNYLSNEAHPSQWIYEVERLESDDYFDFINLFLNMLETKYPALEKLNIKRGDISFWMLYEYDHQCNLEFDPQSMKRLGENGITLCISCWQK